MNYTTRFLAWRYLFGTARQKNISLMVFISFLGIFIGSFALALVLSVMNGFEKVTHEKLKNIHAHIIMRAHGDDLNMEAIAPILDAEFPQINGYSPAIFKYGMITTHQQTDAPQVVMIKGIDPAHEAQTTTLQQKITTSIDPRHTYLTELITPDTVIIGKKLAESLNVVPGDEITLFFAPDDQSHQRKIVFNQQHATVSGFFETGIEEFDSGLVICSFDLIHAMWPESGASQINISIDQHANEAGTVQALKDRFHIQVYSWQELYPALVSALKLEKYAMFFILALIALVASLNIISLQSMHIAQKRGDIAILKTLGMHSKQIMHIFLTIGLLITTSAALTGLGAAAIVGMLLKKYPFITLPDVYYVTHLPIHLEWHLFALVFIVIFLLGFLATWIPVRQTKLINIAEVLRFDA